MANKKAPAVVEAPAEPAAPPAEKITQREAVTKAIDAGKGSPAEGVVYVQEHFGITLGNAAFSTLKSQLKKTASPTVKKPQSSSAKEPVVAPLNGSIGVASQVEAIKGLCEQLGADQVVTIARLFGK